MSSLAAYDAFHARLVPGWTETPVVFENENWQLPAARAPFVYVEIVGDTFDQDTIGAPQANQFLETGFTFLHVMVPTGTGSRDGRAHADALMNLFREQVLPVAGGEGIHMRSFSIGEGQPERVFANYWAMTLTISWDRRDITNLSP